MRTILKLKCGTGNDATRLADVGYSVTAIDLSGEAIDQARAMGTSRYLVHVYRFKTNRMASDLVFMRSATPRESTR